MKMKQAVEELTPTGFVHWAQGVPLVAEDYKPVLGGGSTPALAKIEYIEDITDGIAEVMNGGLEQLYWNHTEDFASICRRTAYHLQEAGLREEGDAYTLAIARAEELDAELAGEGEDEDHFKDLEPVLFAGRLSGYYNAVVYPAYEATR